MKKGLIKQSSTVSARAAFEALTDSEAGYAPRLVNPERPLAARNWGSVITDRNVAHSSSGKSIEMIDIAGRGRPAITLPVKGMLRDAEVDLLERVTRVQLRQFAP